MLDDYTATKVLDENGNSKHYIAESKSTEDCFLIGEFYEREAINMFIADFVYLSQNRFPEFVECFSENSIFYIVFKYTKGVSLLKFLENEKLAFNYRLSIAKNIIFKLRELGNIPVSLQRTALTPQNIVIEEGNIFFNYKIDLSELKLTEDRSIFQETAALLEEMFTYKEAVKNNRLRVILDKCKKDIYESLGELLKDFDYLSKEEIEALDLKTAIEEKKKTIIKKTRNIVAVASLLAGLAFFCYEYIIRSRENVPIFAPIEEIGLVQIISNAESNDELTLEDKITIYVRNIIKEEQPPEEIPYKEPPIEEPPVEEPPITETIAEIPVPDIILEYMIYIVKPGDNLHKICRAYYGDIKELARVIEYNQLRTPNLIYPEQVIKLPNKDLFLNYSATY